MSNRNLILLALLALGAIIGAENQAQARDRDQALLNRALETSMSERAGVEKSFKAAESAKKRGERKTARAISVEIGDELGSQGGAHDNVLDKRVDHRGFHESGVAKKLDREWKEVNSSFQNVEAPGSDSRDPKHL